MPDPSDRVVRFHRLHTAGCFVMPNPWDAGSARALEQLGFQALATTSAGMAWSLARPDNGATLEQALDHLRAISSAVAVPVNADFEGGYADGPGRRLRQRERRRSHRDRRTVDRGLVQGSRRPAVRS